MVYTTLLEPYYYPTLIPIEVTVLRGARRLRFTSSLRRKYGDFAPKIWHILAKLGYQRYLQKIYVGIEFPQIVTSTYYQLPIVVAILEAVGMLRLKSPLYSIGRFLADYTISYPLFKTSPAVIPGIKTSELTAGEKVEQYLNHIHTLPIELHQPIFDMTSLFPGVRFQESAIHVSKTPLHILKKIPEQTWRESTLFISLRRNSLPEQLLQFLQTIAVTKKIILDYKKCFCEKDPCTCTKTEKSIHTEQLLFLKDIQ